MENEHINKIMYSLGQIDSKLDAMKESQDGFSKGLEAVGRRVTDLELFKSNIAGKMVVMMAIGTFAINAIWEWLKTKVNI